MSVRDDIPTVAVLMGDRNGVGPEIVAKVLADGAAEDAGARIVLVADAEVLACGERHAGASLACRRIETLEKLGVLLGEAGPFFLARRSCPAGEPVGTGQVSRAAGAEVLDQLGFLLDAGRAGRIDGIAPALARAAGEGIAVSGPLPADSVFVATKDGAFDAVVAMYHDQSQLALKLLGFGHGVTLLAGLPVPITTVMHGTGYDIVGQGKAVSAGFAKALALCCKLAAAGRSGGAREDRADQARAS